MYLLSCPCIYCHARPVSIVMPDLIGHLLYHYLLMRSPVKPGMTMFGQAGKFRFVDFAKLNRMKMVVVSSREFRANQRIFLFCHTHSLSGCWPSCAFHIHSVIFISVNTAVNDDSSGEQAYTPKLISSAPAYM